MRETKGHTANRRSHHKITAPRLSVCSNCKEYHKRHYACSACGHYRGKAVAILNKSTQARDATPAQALASEGSA
jgi:large subunit ribosomal protein L32